MRGLYVDQNACMVLVLITREDEELSEYRVHGTTAFETSNEWTATCHLSSSKVILLYEGIETTGTRNDDGAIEWDGGDTWQPIHMSSTQFAFMTHRPYVPITYVFYMVMTKLFSRSRSLFDSAHSSKRVSETSP